MGFIRHLGWFIVISALLTLLFRAIGIPTPLELLIFFINVFAVPAS